jgi:hypothetical protein
MNTDPIKINGHNDFLEHVIKSRTPVVVLFYSQGQYIIENLAKDLAHELAKHNPPIPLALCNYSYSDHASKVEKENSDICSDVGYMSIGTHAVIIEYGVPLYKPGAWRGHDGQYYRGPIGPYYIMTTYDSGGSVTVSDTVSDIMLWVSQVLSS